MPQPLFDCQRPAPDRNPGPDIVAQIARRVNVRIRYTPSGRNATVRERAGRARQEGSAVGAIGFVQFDWKAREIELGYWIAKDEEGNGTVTAARRALIDYAFRDLGLNRVEIRCSTENTRSAAIPNRLGFILEATRRQSELRNNRLHDFHIYGLLADEWK